MRDPSLGTPPSVGPSEDRLDSWKEIAAYLNRDVRTVQRWENREGMPVHRHLHDRMGSVYAFRAELDAWARGRNLRAAQENGNEGPSLNPPAVPGTAIPTSLIRWRFIVPLVAAGAVLAIGTGLWFQKREYFWRNPIADARIRPSRTSMEWSRTLRCHATVSLWRFCRTGTDGWTSGLRRSVLDSSTT